MVVSIKHEEVTPRSLARNLRVIVLLVFLTPSLSLCLSPFCKQSSCASITLAEKDLVRRQGGEETCANITEQNGNVYVPRVPKIIVL